jgi:hypothetical protein
MKPDERVDRTIERLLVETPTSRAPDRLRRDIASQTSRQRQRPPWLASLKEPPMRHRSHVAFGSPTTRMAALAAATLLVATLSAGALVAGAQSPSPSPSPAPSEVPTGMETAWVTGTIGEGGQFHPHFGTVTVEGVAYGSTHTTDVPIEMSDSRLSGTLSEIHTVVFHPVAGDDRISLLTGEYRIENEGGSWEGAQVGLQRDSDAFQDRAGETTTEVTVTDTGVLVGSGDYEGLTAYLVFDWPPPPETATITGAIFPGELPPQVTFEELPEE